MQVSKNKVVYLKYAIANALGEIFEQSDLPMGYIQGTERGLLPKVEQALEGCEPGDSVSVELSPREGFGEHQAELTYTDDLENVPPQYRQVGAKAQFQNDRGELREFTVSKIENGKLTLDGNHPLAGQTITFHITVMDVREPSPEELAAGQPLDLSPGQVPPDGPTVH